MHAGSLESNSSFLSALQTSQVHPYRHYITQQQHTWDKNRFYSEMPIIMCNEGKPKDPIVCVKIHFNGLIPARTSGFIKSCYYM